MTFDFRLRDTHEFEVHTISAPIQLAWMERTMVS